MKILLIEDEARVRSFLADSLRAEGNQVTCCGSYDEVLSQLAQIDDDIDVVVLDRLLGRHDAVSLIPAIKGKLIDAKILVLSTLAGGAQKANVLDMGVDDYMGKPFELVELQARLRLLSRRTKSASSAEPTKLEFADIKMDLLAHRAWCSDRPLDLSNKEYHLLLEFMRQPGKVFSRFQLLDSVWNTQFDVESNVVEVTIRNLRKALSDHGSAVNIMSRRNIGYWLEA